MPQTDGERLATIEQILRDRGDDLHELREENKRTRTRLHNLEGAVGGLMDVQKVARRDEATQYRRLEIKLQAVGLLLAAAAILSPIIAVLVVGK